MSLSACAAMALGESRPSIPPRINQHQARQLDHARSSWIDGRAAARGDRSASITPAHHPNSAPWPWDWAGTAAAGTAPGRRDLSHPIPAAARRQEITRAQGSVTAQRPHRLAKPLRRVTPSRPAAGVGSGAQGQIEALRRVLKRAEAMALVERLGGCVLRVHDQRIATD